MSTPINHLYASINWSFREQRLLFEASDFEQQRIDSFSKVQKEVDQERDQLLEKGVNPAERQERVQQAGQRRMNRIRRNKNFIVRQYGVNPYASRIESELQRWATRDPNKPYQPYSFQRQQGYGPTRVRRWGNFWRSDHETPDHEVDKVYGGRTPRERAGFQRPDVEANEQVTALSYRNKLQSWEMMDKTFLQPETLAAIKNTRRLFADLQNYNRRSFIALARRAEKMVNRDLSASRSSYVSVSDIPRQSVADSREWVQDHLKKLQSIAAVDNKNSKRYASMSSEIEYLHGFKNNLTSSERTLIEGLLQKFPKPDQKDTDATKEYEKMLKQFEKLLGKKLINAESEKEKAKNIVTEMLTLSKKNGKPLSKNQIAALAETLKQLKPFLVELENNELETIRDGIIGLGADPGIDTDADDAKKKLSEQILLLLKEKAK